MSRADATGLTFYPVDHALTLFWLPSCSTIARMTKESAMTSRLWVVAALMAGLSSGCSSENHGTTQNPDASGDSIDDSAHCSLTPEAHRPAPITCAPSTGGVADQCTTDDQCSSGAMCGCSTYFNGNVIHSNLCIATQCQVDNDCGPGGFCSPSFTGHCSSLTGFYCHTTADSCSSNACCTDPARPLCEYAPQLGHWACQSVIVCNG
jgi:hypothetical protein